MQHAFDPEEESEEDVTVVLSESEDESEEEEEPFSLDAAFAMPVPDFVSSLEDESVIAYLLQRNSVLQVFTQLCLDPSLVSCHALCVVLNCNVS